MAIADGATRRQLVAWNRLEKAIRDAFARRANQVAAGLAGFFGFFGLVLAFLLAGLRATGRILVGGPATSSGSGPARKYWRHSGDSCDFRAIMQAVTRS